MENVRLFHIGNWPKTANFLIVSLLLASVVACGFGIFTLSAHVRSEINDLARADVDNTQWSLSQNEIELLAMMASANGLGQTGLNLAEFRKRFDIFYSRMQTLERSDQFINLRQFPIVAENIQEIRAFLDRQVPLIDGDDASLTKALPQILSEAAQLREKLRQISLAGINHFAAQSDFQRDETKQTLVRIGALTGIMVLELVGMVLAMNILVHKTRQQARELVASSERHETVIATSLDAIIVSNSRGEILDYNRAAEEIFGYQRDEIVGKTLEETIIPPHLHHDHAERFRLLIETNGRRSIRRGRVQTEAMHKFGRTFPVEFSFSAAASPTSSGPIFVSYIRDISARLAAEQELVTARDRALQGEQAKAAFLAVMSHEMRTPLNGLLGTLELLQDSPLDQDQRHLVSVMANSGELLLNHVNDVLDIARLDAGKMALSIGPFDANSLVREIGESQRSVAEARQNTLTVHSNDPSLGLVLGDAKRVRQILLNLVGNAVKFTEGGHIILSARRADDNFVEFRVQDSGIGISPEDQRRIFEDFVTIDSSYDRRVGGTGLGLGIVRRLVKAMQGKIGLDSSPGLGSLFWFRIPLPATCDRIASHPQSQPDGDTPLWSGRKVLVVEDNKTNRFIVERLLKRAGCAVEMACDGAEGVAKARAEPFDLIFMDISMPRMNGLDATRAIRKDASSPCARVPIVALTAHALPEDLARFAEAGMDKAITKPISGESLRSALQSLLHVTTADPPH